MLQRAARRASAVACMQMGSLMRGFPHHLGSPWQACVLKCSQLLHACCMQLKQQCCDRMGGASRCVSHLYVVNFAPGSLLGVNGSGLAS